MCRSTIVHSSAIRTKEQQNLASFKDRHAAEEAYKKNPRDSEGIPVNISRTLQAQQRVPLAKPGKVVGQVVSYENGSIMKDAHDPRTHIRSAVLPPHAAPSAYCYRKSNSGKQERSTMEADSDLSSQKQAQQCGMAAKYAPDVAINIDSNPFFMTRVGVNKVEHVDDRVMIDTSLLQAKAQYGGIGASAAAASTAAHRKVGTVQYAAHRKIGIVQYGIIKDALEKVSEDQRVLSLVVEKSMWSQIRSGKIALRNKDTGRYIASMEDSLNQVMIPTFHKRKERKTTHDKSEMAKHESLVSLKRSRRAENVHKRSRRKREMSKVQEKDQASTVGAGEDDEKAEVDRKIVALQMIIPGGESFGVDKLFEETAGYIMALQCQIKAMRVLAGFLEGLEKEKRKSGG
ncbi:hypothetical protein NC653_005625 [Populus alba x Populus x berolinensis]|uniref:Uncharacterized protein n=1 Tax=Populus alba x Populus x berolinensis TaxID=444605 RepID=A0AAD6WDA7_9ROSI|nr:hypothetical protein NC653_005625 [Populus alba x Populus x berolinensis]